MISITVHNAGKSTSVEIPSKTGNEGFAALDAFERMCGGPIVDEERNKRYAEIMKARNEKEQEKRGPKVRRRSHAQAARVSRKK